MMRASSAFKPFVAALVLVLPCAAQAACLHNNVNILCPINPATMQPIPDGSQSFFQNATTVCWLFPMNSGSACTPQMTFTPVPPSSPPPSGTPPQAPVVPPPPPAVIAPATAALIAATLPTEVRGMLALTGPQLEVPGSSAPLPASHGDFVWSIITSGFTGFAGGYQRDAMDPVWEFIHAGLGFPALSGSDMEAPHYDPKPLTGRTSFYYPGSSGLFVGGAPPDTSQLMGPTLAEWAAAMAPLAATGRLGTSESERRFAVELERAMTERDRGRPLSDEQKTLLDEYEKAKAEIGSGAAASQAQASTSSAGRVSQLAFPGWTIADEPQGDSATELRDFVFRPGPLALDGIALDSTDAQFKGDPALLQTDGGSPRTFFVQHVFETKGSAGITFGFDVPTTATEAGVGMPQAAGVTIFMFDEQGARAQPAAPQPRCAGDCVTLSSGRKLRRALEQLAGGGGLKAVGVQGLQGAGAREVVLSYAVVTIQQGASEDANVLAFITNQHTSAFDLSVFGFSPGEIQSAGGGASGGRSIVFDFGTDDPLALVVPAAILKPLTEPSANPRAQAARATAPKPRARTEAETIRLEAGRMAYNFAVGDEHAARRAREAFAAASTAVKQDAALLLGRAHVSAASKATDAANASNLAQLR